MLDELYDNYLKIVVNEIPLIDVRSNIEYEKGSFPNSINIPILNNEERHSVGITYREYGQEEAIKLGYLLTKDNKQEKVSKWYEHIKENPNALIYCFRGGLRSQIATNWLFEAHNMRVKRINGGYKALRNFLIESLLMENQKHKPIRLGGYTGVGKTILLNEINNSIDLEGLANHRGSIFGPRITPQPSQIDFENALAYKVLQKVSDGHKHLIYEDEGKHVGKSYLPNEFYKFLREGPLVVLHEEIDVRIEHILKEYVIDAQLVYKDEYGEEGLDKWFSYIERSIKKAKDRLGSSRYLKMIELLESSLKEQLNTGDPHAHCTWIESFLVDYYDPMYEYQINKVKRQIVFEGNYQEVKEYLDNLEKEK